MAASDRPARCHHPLRLPDPNGYRATFAIDVTAKERLFGEADLVKTYSATPPGGSSGYP